MGMVGQIYVRPRQNRVPVGHDPVCGSAAQQQTGSAHGLQSGRRHPVHRHPLHSTPVSASRSMQRVTGGHQSEFGQPQKYAYNDGDGSTAYDVEYPLQIHGFDPNFHFVGMTFNPEAFADMKDKFFLLNGRSYPDTVTPGPLTTESFGRQQSLLAAAAFDHQHPRRRQGAAAHLRPRRDRISDAGFAGHSDARDRLQRQAAARPGRQQHGLLHQLDHAGRRRVARRDPGCQQHSDVSGRAGVLSLHAATSITCRTTQRTSAG